MDKPNIQLSGEDGNAFVIISRGLTAIKKWNREHPDNQIDEDEFQHEAMSGDYDHVLQVAMEYFNVS